jgi:hypothetical protein
MSAARFVLAAVALTAVAAVPQSALGGEPLVTQFSGLGDRISDRAPIPDVKPRPLWSPARGPAAAYPLRGPTGVRIVRGGVTIVAESMTGRVLRVGRNGRVSVLAGRRADDFSACPAVRSRAGLIVADRGGNRVVRRSRGGATTTIAGTGRTGFAGDGGPATAARLNGPTCVAAVADGSLLIADQGNRRVRRIAPDGTITTIAGNGEAGFAGEGGPATAAALVPQDIVALPDGGALVTDARNARVLAIDAEGTLSTFAGTGEPGYDGDGGPARAARLTMPWGLARAADGAVVVSDFGSQTVRRISPSGEITTILGAPPQPSATRSRALGARIPARRRVVSWITPQPGTSSFGERRVSDEAESGRRAVIREQGYGGTITFVSVVQGATTLVWGNVDAPDCWQPDRTAVGLAGDPVQARDVQAGARAGSPYAPGPGPYAPDLARGGLVLARAPISLAGEPAFGVPAWWTEWAGRRLVDYVIDRRTRRVVALQVWSPSGFERQYRIRALPRSAPLRLPSTRPMRHITQQTPQFTAWRCGPPGRRPPAVYGFPEGIGLARRVARGLDGVHAMLVRATGRAAVGRRFTATSAVTLRRGRVLGGLTRIVAPGRPQANVLPPGGSYTELSPPSGGTFIKALGTSCWAWTGLEEPGEVEPPAFADRSRVMPLDDAFFERPRRRGRLLVLRAHVSGLTIDSLIDPRDLRLLAQRWVGRDRGLVRFAAVPSLPPLPVPVPRCPR